MATNPDRPLYQDIIDEAWGVQVADHVIRRYRDAAERDLDFTGIAAAELAGQVVAITPSDGSPPYLQQHDGTAWGPIMSGAGCSVFQNAAITFSTGMFHFDTVVDSDGHYDPATGLYTCAHPGDYLVTGTVTAVAAIANDTLNMSIARNGALAFIGPMMLQPNNGWNIAASHTAMVRAVAGDTLGVYVEVNQNTNRTGLHDAAHTYMVIRA
jgi:hypothetical protein